MTAVDEADADPGTFADIDAVQMCFLARQLGLVRAAKAAAEIAHRGAFVSAQPPVRRHGIVMAERGMLRGEQKKEQREAAHRHPLFPRETRGPLVAAAREQRKGITLRLPGRRRSDKAASARRSRPISTNRRFRSAKRRFQRGNRPGSG
jgi:hypothetical protein